MSLSVISPASAKEELDVQNIIDSYIDNDESIVFNAGAGSGKTYALAESLKYIIQKHGDRLKHHNQKIMCITYTNVATNEIRERLGNSDLVRVSTIHERLWALIKDYRKELVRIHAAKIKEELTQLQFDLNENPEEKAEKQFRAFRDLNDNQRTDFKNVMLVQKNNFNKYYDKAAKEFKSVLGVHLAQYSSILSNVANFKKIVNTIYKIENYSDCLVQIDAKNPKFSEVRYEDKYNTDILHRMIISHDTLLEYSLTMIKTYDLLRRVILDTYPYILIDEYQDTNESVVQIMRFIEDHAKSIKRKIFIGYFGDSAQNIYEDGIGTRLLDIHPGLKIVNKQFNRRSHSEIIDVINKIRNDDIKQKSIYDDCAGGSVKFYTGVDETKHQFIAEYKKKWNINKENKLHCMVLLNKFVAEFNGFPDIYDCFSETAYYKRNYDRLNNELLSNDLSKLGNIPNLFYRILQFINNLNNPKTILANLINKKIYSQMTIAELKKLVAILKDIKGVSLGEYVKDIFEKYENSGSAYYKQVIRELINIESYSHQHVTNYLLDELFLNIGSARIEDFKLKLLELFNENLVVKAAEKETLELKHQLEQLTGNQSLSYLDTEEVNNFKNKIHKLLNSQKISGISDKDIDPFRSKVDKLFEDEIFSIVDIDEAEEAKKKLDLLLSIKLDQWAIWHKFINDEQEIDTVYYTYHGTKGAEFDNVIIIMENDFGRLSPDKFSSFFEHYANPIPLDEKETAQLYNTRNLLYVSCSRAIKNLRILYLDDISEFKKGIENIFGTISPYQPGEISA